MDQPAAAATAPQTPSLATERAPTQAASLAALGQVLLQEFSTAEKMRYTQELEWLKDIRQFKGQYDPEVQAKIHPKRSRTFVRMTRAKVRSADSRLGKMLFPAGDKNWTIDPTPIPEFGPDQMNDLRMLVGQMTGGAIDVAQLPREQLEQAIAEEAKKRCGKMSTQMDDQLTEGRYAAKARRVLHSGHLYGTGILKGPLVEFRKRKSWTLQVDAATQAVRFVKEEKETAEPDFDQREVWAIYPDPYATDFRNCEYVWDRHILNKHQLLKQAAGLKLDMPYVRDYVFRNPQGDSHALKHWESDLLTIGMRDLVGQPKNRYELLERWGYLYGRDLIQAGVMTPEQVDEAQEFEARVFMLGGYVVKASLNPFESKEKPFHAYYFDKDESSIWGNSIPSIYRDTQASINAGVRVSQDNAAIAGGPLLEVNRELMEDEDQPEDIFPFRTWVRTGLGAEATAPAVRVYDVPSKVKEHLEMVRVWKDLGDEISTLPSYTYGMQGQGVARTVGGLSMLMGQSNMALEEPVKNWDEGVTEPFISALYDWNMQFNKREDIKGDYCVKARGSSALLAKELRSQAVQGFRMSTLNAFDAPATKRTYLLREEAKSLDLDPELAVMTEEEELQLKMTGMLPGGPGAPGAPGAPAGAMPGDVPGQAPPMAPDALAGQGLEPGQAGEVAQ